MRYEQHPLVQAVSKLEGYLKTKYGLSELWLSYNRGIGVMVLHMIEVPKALRKEGRADRALEEMCRFADENHLTFALSPSSDFGSLKARLIKWYRRHGFVPNKGRNKD